MDITVLFKACVKTIKTRNRAFGECTNETEKTKILSSRTRKCQFTMRSREILQQITRLRDFLYEHKKAYLNFSNYLSEIPAMSDYERDRIDAGAQMIINSCSNLISELEKDTVMKQDCQNSNHKRIVLQLMKAYLKEICKMYSEQKAVRVQRSLEIRKMSKMESTSPKRESNNMDGKRIRVGEATAEVLLHESEPLSPEELQMFELENNRLYNELNSLSDEIKQIESKVVKIAELQDVFTEKVLEQDRDIDRIATTIIGTTENVKDANEQIRRAIQRNAGLRDYVVEPTCSARKMRKFFTQTDENYYEFHVEDEGKLWELVREMEKFEEPKETKGKVKKGNFCRICKKKFRSKYHLRLHMPVHTGEKNFLCGICKKGYQQKWNLITHMDRVHAKEKPFKCMECGKLYGYSSHFKRHIKMHFVEKMQVPDEIKRKILNPFSCKLCPKSFDSNYRLKLHIEKHTGRGQYVCDKCGRSFRTKRMINNHLTEHEDVDFKGEKSSGDDTLSACRRPREVQKLSESTVVKITERNVGKLYTHQGKELISCEVCGKIIMKESMKKHLNIHYRSRVYECRYCSKEFLESSQRTIHERKHTGEKPYLCDFCGKRHSQYGNLLTHLITNHNATRNCKSQTYEMNEIVPILNVPNEENADENENANDINSVCGNLNINDPIILLCREESIDETLEKSDQIPLTWISDKVAEFEHTKIHAAENLQIFAKYIPGTEKTCTVTTAKDDSPVPNTDDLIKPKDDEVRKRMNFKIFEKIVEDLGSSANTRVKAAIENIRNSFVTEDKDPLKEFLKIKKYVPVNNVIRQVNGKSQWFCWICNSIFSNRHILARHLLIHEPVEARPFRCYQCQKTFTQSSNYKEHLMSHSNENQFYCEKCGSGFRHKSHFNNHMKKHSETAPQVKPRRFECPYCEKKFQTNYHRSEHVRTHTGEKPHVCQICGAQFSTLSTLNRHAAIHTNAWYQCQTCSKLFKQKSSLKRHAAIHAENYGKNITCECGKSFCQASSLAKHKTVCKSRDKPVAKPFECSLCQKKFSTKSDLKRHSATHDTSKKFQCNVCSVSLKTAETYKRHIRRHKENTIK